MKAGSKPNNANCVEALLPIDTNFIMYIRLKTLKVRLNGNAA